MNAAQTSHEDREHFIKCSMESANILHPHKILARAWMTGTEDNVECHSMTLTFAAQPTHETRGNQRSAARDDCCISIHQSLYVCGDEGECLPHLLIIPKSQQSDKAHKPPAECLSFGTHHHPKATTLDLTRLPPGGTTPGGLAGCSIKQT